MLKLLQITLAALWLVLQSACTDVEQAEPLRIGFNPWPGYEFIYLAKVKGFYEANDIDVKLVELNALGDVRRAFERGQIDIMASTMNVRAAVALLEGGESQSGHIEKMNKAEVKNIHSQVVH